MQKQLRFVFYFRFWYKSEIHGAYLWSNGQRFTFVSPWKAPRFLGLLLCIYNFYRLRISILEQTNIKNEGGKVSGVATLQEEEVLIHQLWKREREQSQFDLEELSVFFICLEREKIFREIERKEMASKSSSSSSAAAANNHGRTRVGKYELGRTLGEGNFAKVKFARNVDTGENVAIKILDKEKILKHKMIAQVLTVIIILIFQFIFSNRSNQIWFFFLVVRFIDSIKLNLRNFFVFTPSKTRNSICCLTVIVFVVWLFGCREKMNKEKEQAKCNLLFLIFNY